MIRSRRFHVARIDALNYRQEVVETAFPREAVLAAFPDSGQLRCVATPREEAHRIDGGVGATTVYAGTDDCRYIVEEVRGAR